MKNERLKSKWDTLRSKADELKLIKRNGVDEKYIGALNDFRLEFDQLFTESNGSNYFHKYCSSRVFEAAFEDRLLDYLRKNPEANDLDFCEKELKSLRESIDFGMGIEHTLKLVDNDIYQLLNHDVQKNLKLGERNKVDFILKKSNKNQSKTEVSMHRDSNDIEPSNNTKLKVAYLAELGVLDFLKDKYNIQSNRKLALLAAEFTGDNRDNIIRTVNDAMGDLESRNNPRTPENLDTIKAKLIQLKIFQA